MLTLQLPLSAFRRRQVVAAFTLLDTADTGVISLDTVLTAFQAGKHPTVVSSRREAADVLKDFRDTFQCGLRDRKV